MKTIFDDYYRTITFEMGSVVNLSDVRPSWIQFNNIGTTQGQFKELETSLLAIEGSELWDKIICYTELENEITEQEYDILMINLAERKRQMDSLLQSKKANNDLELKQIEEENQVIADSLEDTEILFPTWVEELNKPVTAKIYGNKIYSDNKAIELTNTEKAIVEKIIAEAENYFANWEPESELKRIEAGQFKSSFVQQQLPNGAGLRELMIVVNRRGINL